MSESTNAQLSVVIAADEYATIRRLVEHLRAQTVHDRLELVIVAPSAEDVALEPSAVADFAGCVVVPFQPITPLRPPRAAGVRAATAPLVAIAETHCFPEPGWAEALIEAHRQPWAVVGAALGNANPDTSMSWAAMLMDYGTWALPTQAHVPRHLASHNVCYKRELLLAQGPAFEAAMGYAVPLQAELRARGYELYLEPAARLHHLNSTRLRPWLLERFIVSRWLAGLRAERWSPARRFVYACGSPLIPFLRLWRIFRGARGPIREHRLLPRVLPLLAVGLVTSAIGEFFGFVFGSGGAENRLGWLEIRKIDSVRKAERAAFA